jgi:hypothetical protein
MQPDSGRLGAKKGRRLGTCGLVFYLGSGGPASQDSAYPPQPQLGAGAQQLGSQQLGSQHVGWQHDRLQQRDSLWQKCLNGRWQLRGAQHDGSQQLGSQHVGWQHDGCWQQLSAGAQHEGAQLVQVGAGEQHESP